MARKIKDNFIDGEGFSIINFIEDKYKDDPTVDQDALHEVLYNDEEFEYTLNELFEVLYEKYKEYKKGNRGD